MLGGRHVLNGRVVWLLPPPGTAAYYAVLLAALLGPILLLAGLARLLAAPRKGVKRPPVKTLIVLGSGEHSRETHPRVFTCILGGGRGSLGRLSYLLSFSSFAPRPRWRPSSPGRPSSRLTLYHVASRYPIPQAGTRPRSPIPLF